jgi:GNAT superfamily N-acetyltransferase
MAVVTGKDGIHYVFRKLVKTDVALLARYFSSLSEATKARFAPHPLTDEYINRLCKLNSDSAERFVLLPGSLDKIVGYFILEYQMSPHEARRYLGQGIHLESELDPLFAPSIADTYQNRGLASSVMPLIIDAAKEHGSRSLVLLGGTQETNRLAIAFYEKLGFKRYGGYQTDIFNFDMRLVFEERTRTPSVEQARD